MLDNYVRLNNGIITQVERQPFQYGVEYSAHTGYGELSLKMSFLRLGYIVGMLGRAPQSLMDIGYGAGDFLKAAQTAVPHCYGFDISPFPTPKGVVKLNASDEVEVEVVTMFDCLEHWDNIYDVTKLRCQYMILSFPDCHYFSDEWFRDWKHRKPNEHLWFFNKDSVRNFAKEVGFTVLNTCNIEDSIRKHNHPYSNILTVALKRD